MGVFLARPNTPSPKQKFDALSFEQKCKLIVDDHWSVRDHNQAVLRGEAHGVRVKAYPTEWFLECQGKDMNSPRVQECRTLRKQYDLVYQREIVEGNTTGEVAAYLPKLSACRIEGL
jgi:hypothetical protein